ncbi:MAG: electron transfer flavoprotein subunit beta/FixA family protein [Lachnospiraceae bacterium]|nr:electron transfer flavoprotein subunit beta/FixA family protein [Lachnospiraceae bacterium]
MNVVVCIKQVPNTKEVRIDPETKNIVREGVPSILNPYDANAIEAALRIKEENGGSVIAISMGPQQAAEVLQEALNMGVDRAILLSDRLFAGSDTLATGYALSGAIKGLKPDLILCGSEAIDGCTGQVGPIIAENLGIPQFTYVHEISVQGNSAKVSREVKEGYELLSCKLPVLACVLKGINIPRKPGISEKYPEVLSAKDCNMDAQRLGIKGSPTRVAHISSSGKSISSFVSVDGSLSPGERIKLLMNGGIVPKKINFTKGTARDLAEVILSDSTVKGHLHS